MFNELILTNQNTLKWLMFIILPFKGKTMNLFKKKGKTMKVHLDLIKQKL